MKKLLFFLFFPYLILAQNLKSDSLSIISSFNESDTFYSGYNANLCYGNNTSTLNSFKGEMLHVTNIFKCKEKYIVGTYLLGDYGYLVLDENSPKKFIMNDHPQPLTIQEILPLFETISEEVKEKGRQFSERLSAYTALLLLDKLGNQLLKYSKYSIGIIRANPTEDYSMTGAEFKIMNFSKKTIKYITFNFYGKNAVKDKVLYRQGAYSASRKGIGPVEQYETGSWSFDSVWLTDIVQSMSLTSVTIQYMDGTSRVVKVTDDMWLDQDLIDQFDKIDEQHAKVKDNY